MCFQRLPVQTSAKMKSISYPSEEYAPVSKKTPRSSGEKRFVHFHHAMQSCSIRFFASCILLPHVSALLEYAQVAFISNQPSSPTPSTPLLSMHVWKPVRSRSKCQDEVLFSHRLPFYTCHYLVWEPANRALLDRIASIFCGMSIPSGSSQRYATIESSFRPNPHILASPHMLDWGRATALNLTHANPSEKPCGWPNPIISSRRT